jgi:hypothetical protein
LLFFNLHGLLQIEGAFIQGLGWAAMEELKWGDDNHKWIRPGHLFTCGPGSYKIPSVNDIPLNFKVSLLKVSFPLFPFLYRPGRRSWILIEKRKFDSNITTMEKVLFFFTATIEVRRYKSGVLAALVQIP